jgi:hypothetical protein
MIMGSKWNTKRTFICHRRKDTAHISGRVYDRLVSVHGEDLVYIDVESTRPGTQDYLLEIRRAIENSRLMIVMIGEEWLSNGGLSAHVRAEIEGAIYWRLSLLPVLIDHARMPRAVDLPSGFGPLLKATTESLRHAHFSRDMTGLLSTVERLLNETDPAEPDPYINIGGVVENPDWERWRRRGR